MSLNSLLCAEVPLRNCSLTHILLPFTFVLAPTSEYSCVIGRHQKRLSEIIQPDFGLVHQLLSRDVITYRDHEEVRAGESIYSRTDRLLHRLSSAALTSSQYHELLSALDYTRQTHVANFIRGNGGSSFFALC